MSAVPQTAQAQPMQQQPTQAPQQAAAAAATTTGAAGAPGQPAQAGAPAGDQKRPDEKKFAGLHSFVIYDKKFTVDAKYLPKKPLGKGAYGVVCACVDQTTGRKVAIKKIPDAFEDLIDAKRILREIKLLRHFNHDNVIKLYDMIEPPEHGPFDDIYMVFELMDIDMSKSMQVNKNELTDEHFQYFIYQMLRGLKYIHSANVLHRDLKPSNLLLNSDCKLKVCDFGLSRGVKKNVKEVDYELTEYVVTRWYRAPEVMCSSHEYDYKLDVWAVGCILAELVLGKPLFPGRDNIHQMQLIFQLLGTPSDDDMKRISSEKALDLLKKLPHCKKVNFKEKFAKANPLAVDLIEKTLEFNPLKRISVNDALKHPYLAKFRQPEQETDCKTPFDFEFEKVPMTKHRLREFIWEEVLAYRPGAKAKHERWLRNEQERQKKAAQKVAGASAAAANNSASAPMKLG